MPTNGWGNIYCNSWSGDTATASETVSFEIFSTESDVNDSNVSAFVISWRNAPEEAAPFILPSQFPATFSITLD